MISDALKVSERSTLRSQFRENISGVIATAGKTRSLPNQILRKAIPKFKKIVLNSLMCAGNLFLQ